MKKGILSVITSLVACLGLCFGMTACGAKTVEQEVYTGNVNVEGDVGSVELIFDDFGTFTFIKYREDGEYYFGFGGNYRRSGNNITFESLEEGDEIATATMTKSRILLNLEGDIFELKKSVKKVQIDDLYGAYKGCVDDRGAFELRLILRGDGNWVIIEEDSDVHAFGKYTLEGDLITAYYNDEPDEICAFGTVNGTLISMNVEGDDISFQKL